VRKIANKTISFFILLKQCLMRTHVRRQAFTR
jgi:hypothetical protein